MFRSPISFWANFFFPKQVIGDQNMEGKDRFSLSSFQVHKVIQIVSEFYVLIVGNKEGNYSREESIQGRIL
jgi:hypothetical protein